MHSSGSTAQIHESGAAGRIAGSLSASGRSRARPPDYSRQPLRQSNTRNHSHFLPYPALAPHRRVIGEAQTRLATPRWQSRNACQTDTHQASSARLRSPPSVAAMTSTADIAPLSPDSGNVGHWRLCCARTMCARGRRSARLVLFSRLRAEP